MSKGANNTYWGNIKESVFSLWNGMRLTFRHLFDARIKRKQFSVKEKEYFEEDKGVFTLQYPFESMPVPDNGRYRLHNEIDDCIVCDLCAKICPVNCIEIEPVKSAEEIGKTSDGTTKRLYAAKFDIDMAKCCYCGLCTTVCPTECLTMTKTYDYSEFDIRNMVYHFTNLSPEEAEEKKLEFEKHQEVKAQAKADSAVKPVQQSPAKPVIGKPAIKPQIPKPSGAPSTGSTKPVIKPVVKPETEEQVSSGENVAKPKPVIKPVIKPKGEEASGTTESKKVLPKPVIKPVIKPKTEEKNEMEEDKKATPKPVIKPVMKPKNLTGDKGNTSGDNVQGEEKKVPKPIIKPVIPKKKKDE
ncbi:MAG: 4Fe-4S dicluster domain-containing protein [Cytophagaceae bacterium]